MTDREELKEKVVAAIRDAWNNAPNDGPISNHLADAAIAVALEEAADVVGEVGDCAEVGAYIAAIRALKEKP